jgi:tripartite-type tricarboxylate transporter receptor subunit TctC
MGAACLHPVAGPQRKYPPASGIAHAGAGTVVITTVADSPYKTFTDVMAASRGGTSLSYGSIGSGSLGQLAVTML